MLEGGALVKPADIEHAGDIPKLVLAARPIAVFKVGKAGADPKKQSVVHEIKRLLEIKGYRVSKERIARILTEFTSRH